MTRIEVMFELDETSRQLREAGIDKPTRLPAVLFDEGKRHGLLREIEGTGGACALYHHVVYREDTPVLVPGPVFRAVDDAGEYYRPE